MTQCLPGEMTQCIRGEMQSAGISHLIFLDCSCPWVAETTEAESAGKGGQYVYDQVTIRIKSSLFINPNTVLAS